MAGVPGNKNAASGREFREQLRYALINFEKGTVKRGQALRKLAEKLIILGIEGDLGAIKEIADRLDGRTVQAVAGPDGGAIEVNLVDARAKLFAQILSDSTES